MRIRKSTADLTDQERNDFIKAILFLKHKIVNPNASEEDQFSKYDRFAAIHGAVMSVNVPDESEPINMGHGGPVFLPWHREFLLQFQAQIDTVVKENESHFSVPVTIPYWDWTAHDHTEKELLRENFLGASGPKETPIRGYFAESTPTDDERPDWWPKKIEGWKLNPALIAPGEGKVLVRRVRSVTHLSDWETHILPNLDLPDYHTFWRWLEGGVRTHDSMHNWVGGNMSNPLYSPNDPIFMLNHANVDRLWALWQSRDHDGPTFYPADENWSDQESNSDTEQLRPRVPKGHRLNDAMWPWVGKATGYESRVGEILQNSRLDVIVGVFSGEPERQPIDVLDTKDLPLRPEQNYQYQEPVTRFREVRAILNDAIERWREVNRENPDLSGHGDNFGWETRTQLLASAPRGQILIASDQIGVNAAEDTNIVRVLRTGLPIFASRMPKRGPFLPDNKIDRIAGWIDDGCQE